jgi:tetratricopeptide (TPR) repeat protein
MVVILAMVQFGGTLNCVAAPATSDQLPLDWPSGTPHESENAKAQTLADRGRSAYLAGDYSTAVSNFSELLKLKPADARVYYNRGNAYYRMRDLENALADFSETLKIAPNMYLALMNRGNIYSEFKRYDEAISDYDKALALKPDQFLIYFNRGIAFGRLSDYARALSDFTQAIRLKPDDAMSYSSRGDVLYRQHNFDQARQDYTKAVELDSSLAHAAERLRALPVRDGSPVAAAQSIDTSTIAAEISHRQAIARLVSLAGQSCLQNGENEKGLAALAAAKNWSAVGDIELKKVSNGTTTMVNGWTFSDEVGSVAVMQSKVNDAQGVYICSMTAKVGSPQAFEDFRAEFEKQLRAAPEGPVEQASDTTIRYWLPHKPTCDAKTSLVMSSERGTVTVRMLHGRKTDGA